MKGSVFFNSLDKESIQKRIEENPFPFSQNLMWDYPLKNLDVKKHRNYVVERIITRGGIEDFYIMLQVYSKREIQEAIKKSKELDPKMANFCSRYFNIPKAKIHVSLFYSDAKYAELTD